MRQFIFLVFSIASLASCVDCKECTYYEKTGQTITYSEKLDGEYCGDEIKAIEKKEFDNISADEGYVTCQ